MNLNHKNHKLKFRESLLVLLMEEVPSLPRALLLGSILLLIWLGYLFHVLACTFIRSVDSETCTKSCWLVSWTSVFVPVFLQVVLDSHPFIITWFVIGNYEISVIRALKRRTLIMILHNFIFDSLGTFI